MKPRLLVAALATSGLLASCDLLSPGSPEPTSAILSPSTLTFDAIGDTASVRAEVRDQDGNVMSDIGVQWSTENAVVATASSAGLVTSASNGTTIVTATAGKASGSVTVSVAQAGAALELLSGDGQSGASGEALGQPLVVRALDRLGHPARAVTVAFVVEEGGGSAASAVAITAADGRAATTWTLGAMAGLSQSVRSFLAHRVGVGVTFNAAAIAGPPAQLRRISGDGQAAPRDATLPDPLVVRVEDRFGNPVPDVQVGFSVTAGVGSVNPGAVQSDVGGLATTSWTLGAPLGDQSVSATVAALAPTTFRATASLVPARSEILGGDGQTGSAGQRLPEALSLRILDGGGAPVSPVDVRFTVASGGGLLEPSGGGATAPSLTVRSDANGVVSVSGWILGTVPGTQTVSVDVPGLASVTLSAMAVTGAPTVLSKVSGDGQVAIAGTLLDDSVRLRVTDSQGNPVAGVKIVFTPDAGHGSASPTSAFTDTGGRASASWTLGSTLGFQQLTASIQGGPGVIFQARATTASGTGLAIELQFIHEFTPSQKQAVEAPAARWRELIAEGLEAHLVQLGAGSCGPGSPAIDRIVDDLLIFIALDSIDGRLGTLAQAGPCVVRSGGLPAVGRVVIDRSDLASLEESGTLVVLVTHEIAHVLGFGTLWRPRGLLQNPSLPSLPGADTHFSGEHAIAAFDRVGGDAYFLGLKVPVENEQGGQGTRDSHWRESVFRNELMTGFLGSGTDPLSIVTLGSLRDLGYQVDESGADGYAWSRAPRTAGGAGAHKSLPLGDDVYRGPIYLVDPQGRIHGVLEP